MKTKIIFLIILLCWPTSVILTAPLTEFSEETLPIHNQKIKELEDANIWKRDSANSQVELIEEKDLDMQSKDIYFEGATADDYETKITVTDPTADRTITIPDADVTLGEGDMSYSDTRFEVGSFTRDISLATGTQEVNLTAAFAPKAVIFISCVDSAAGLATWGVDDATQGKGISDYTSIVDNYYLTNTSSIYIWISVGNDYRGKIDSLDTDGFTVAWTKNGSPTGTVTVNFLAFR